TSRTWPKIRALPNCSTPIPEPTRSPRPTTRTRRTREISMDPQQWPDPLSRDKFASGSLRVVAIGGGTGLSTLLKGLKSFVPAPGEPDRLATAQPVIGELSAVVTVSDDGGSSGRLRKELNMLPPGDIRNCIVPLSEDEDLLSQLFRHRFDKGSGLEGHSFGNLFLAALTSITKDF